MKRARTFRFWGLLQDGFFLWVFAGSLWGYTFPEVASQGTAYIAKMIGLIMLGMGLTLTREDLARLPKAGRALFLGVFLQFLCMPLFGFMLAIAWDLPAELALGTLLVGAAPGGTASNVIAFLSKADVALSVSMTVLSTLLCVLLTPLWVYLLGSIWIDIDPLSLLQTIATIVLGPVLLGILIRSVWTPPRFVLEGVLPFLSMLIIAVVIGIIVGKNRAELVASPTVYAVVITHCALGFTLGILGTRPWIHSEKARTTIGIEVGMQNSGLAVALAIAHFSPLAAVPGAVFSVWQNLFGAAFAAIRRRKAYRD